MRSKDTRSLYIGHTRAVYVCWWFANEPLQRLLVPSERRDIAVCAALEAASGV